MTVEDVMGVVIAMLSISMSPGAPVYTLNGQPVAANTPVGSTVPCRLTRAMADGSYPGYNTEITLSFKPNCDDTGHVIQLLPR